MDLRSGACFWPIADGLLAAYPPLGRNVVCDVAIVGGGVTGALIAHRLTAAGRSCIVIDRREIGWGSTAASTALVLYEIDLPLVDLAERIGRADAERAYRACAGAIRTLERLVRRLPDRCGFARSTSLYLASRPRDAAGLEREHRARRRIGIRVDLLRRRALAAAFPTLPHRAALLSHDAAVCDPYRLTHTLLSDARRHGLRVVDRTAVTGYEVSRHGGTVTLATGRGPTVRARHVVWAGGYETLPMLARRGLTVGRLTSTYAVATEPIGEGTPWPRRTIIWETARPYLYLRGTPDGRAMIGGADEPYASAAARDRLIRRKSTALVGSLRRLFPGVQAEPAFAWAGTFAESEDGLAYCGEAPEFPGVIFALGLGANGITFAVILAELVERMIAGKRPPEADLFRFDR